MGDPHGLKMSADVGNRNSTTMENNEQQPTLKKDSEIADDCSICTSVVLMSYISRCDQSIQLQLIPWTVWNKDIVIARLIHSPKNVSTYGNTSFIPLPCPNAELRAWAFRKA